MNCITCHRPVTEHPRYFAQSHSTPPAPHDPQGLYDDLLHILRYTSSLFQLMARLHDSPPQEQHEKAVENLGQLGHDLCEEAERRAQRLFEAATHWQARSQETNRTVAPAPSAALAVEEAPAARQLQSFSLPFRSVFVLVSLVLLLFLVLFAWQKGMRNLEQPAPPPPPIVHQAPPSAAVPLEPPPPSASLLQAPAPPASLTPIPPSETPPLESPTTAAGSFSPAPAPPTVGDSPQTLSISPSSPSLPEPPQPSHAEQAPAVQPTHQLTIKAKELTWIRATIDGQKIKDVLLQPGEQLEWSARQAFTLTIGNAGGIDLILDGQPLPPLGGSGQVIRNLRLPAASQQESKKRERTDAP
ncbi:MAG: DUF4115 domain-containing protein [Candidatus Binatia bacterium]|nr:DUF4115 domain-containing protein [Candidatus Binatia bacterium]